ncbi:MAG: FAD-binding domain-containing protein [Euzebya sp.]
MRSTGTCPGTTATTVAGSGPPARAPTPSRSSASSTVTQGRRFDPDGDYVRRYVPELTALAAPMIHSPWELSAAGQDDHDLQLGRDYPKPIIDHAVARDRALEWFATHRG